MSNTTVQSGLLREHEAAARLGLKSQTLSVWRCHGQGPPFVRLSGRAVRYEAAALEQFIVERTIEPGASADATGE